MNFQSQGNQISSLQGYIKPPHQGNYASRVKKKFFKENHHHINEHNIFLAQEDRDIYGNSRKDLQQFQSTPIGVSGSPKLLKSDGSPPVSTEEELQRAAQRKKNEIYWSEYRRNYEQQMSSKIQAERDQKQSKQPQRRSYKIDQTQSQLRPSASLPQISNTPQHQVQPQMLQIDVQPTQDVLMTPNRMRSPNVNQLTPSLHNNLRHRQSAPQLQSGQQQLDYGGQYIPDMNFQHPLPQEQMYAPQFSGHQPAQFSNTYQPSQLLINNEYQTVHPQHQSRPVTTPNANFNSIPGGFMMSQSVVGQQQAFQQLSPRSQQAVDRAKYMEYFKTQNQGLKPQSQQSSTQQQPQQQSQQLAFNNIQHYQPVKQEQLFPEPVPSSSHMFEAQHRQTSSHKQLPSSGQHQKYSIDQIRYINRLKNTSLRQKKLYEFNIHKRDFVPEKDRLAMNMAGADMQMSPIHLKSNYQPGVHSGNYNTNSGQVAQVLNGSIEQPQQDEYQTGGKFSKMQALAEGSSQVEMINPEARKQLKEMLDCQIRDRQMIEQNRQILTLTRNRQPQRVNYSQQQQAMVL